MKSRRILVTGSSGLVGTSVSKRLTGKGYDVVGVDLRTESAAMQIDVRETERLREVVNRVDGIVHLAAVSRVITGEREPERCIETNVDALRGLLGLVSDSPSKPWVVFASSREVYGQPARLPVTEDTPLAPVNTYGRSKVAGEQLCNDARAAGIRASVVRLSNVFGSASDHADRVIPAYVRAALAGEPLRIEGAEHTFDFTYVEDSTSGIQAVVDSLEAGHAPLPPVHFVTGVATTLAQLASTILRLTGSAAPTRDAPPRNFDVSTFVGDASRAKALLGWAARVPLEEGLQRLIADFRGGTSHPDDSK